MSSTPAVPEPRLHGRTAIITGAGSGIGRASVERFLAEGANVIAADIDSAAAQETVAGRGDRALAVTTDVTDGTAVQQAVDLALERFGSLDIYYNNAGVPQVAAPVEDVDDATWQTVIDVNLTAVFIAARIVVPIMKRQGSGVILVTASMSGIRPRPALCAYTAAKGGAVNLAKALAIELAEFGIRVNSVNPVSTDTPDALAVRRRRPHNRQRDAAGPPGPGAGDGRGGGVPRLRRRLVHHRHRAPGRRRTGHLSVAPARVVDLAQPITPRMTGWRGTERAVVQIAELDAAHSVPGGRISGTHLQTPAHAGTHVDAARHFFPHGLSIDQYPAVRFACPAVALDVRRGPGEPLGAAELRTLDPGIGPGDGVLLWFGWAERYGQPVYDDHPYLTADAADYLRDLRINVLGVDTLTPDVPHGRRPPVFDFPVHDRLLSADVLIIENLGAQLSTLIGSRFLLTFAPLRLEHGDASPIAPLALVDALS